MLLLPIGHNKEINRFPWLTIGIIILNTIIFVITIPITLNQASRIEELQEEKYDLELQCGGTSYLHGSTEESIDETHPEYERLEAIEAEIAEAESNMLYMRWGYTPSRFRWYTLFTSLFIHAGFFHLIGNMWFLYLIGTSIEDVWGKLYYLGLYFGAGVFACLLHGLIHQGSPVPVVGASGAIAGVMGAFMIRNYKVRMRFFYFFLIFIYPLYGTFYLPAYVALGGWFLWEVFQGLIFGSLSGVAHWAHVGGFLVGAGVATLFKTQQIEEKYIAPKREEDLEAVKLNPKLLEAFQARDSGQLEQATRILQNLISVEPENVDARTELVNTYIAADDMTEVGPEYDKIIDIWARRNDLESLLATYTEVTNLGILDDLSPRNQAKIASVLADREMFDEALKLYRSLIRNQPDHDLAPLWIFKSAMILLKKVDRPKPGYQALQYLLDKYPEIDWRDQVEAELEKIAIHP